MKFRVFACFLFLPAFSFAQSDGLVARFTFNKGNTNNEAGDAPAKAIGVSFVEDRFGNPHSACFLNGSPESYLNLGTGAALKPAQGTISVWVKLLAETYSGRGYWGNPIILTKNYPGDDFYEAYSIGYDLKNKKICVATASSAQDYVFTFSNRPLKIEEWHNIVLTYSDESFCLYIDGNLDNCVRKNFRTRFLATDSVMVGNSANRKNSRFFSGLVDDISIYNKVLTPEEIADLYREADPHRYRNLVLILIASFLFIVGLIGGLIRKFRKALEKEKEKNRIQRQMYEMETKVIKAQMNPHFIFNSMNSIQQFILANDNENANAYLVKFARLLRKVLESNTDEYISVKNEIYILDKYMEMESLRFEHTLNYEIIADDSLNLADTRIPQMLVQPFVENAIWHGLLLKEGTKNLKIIFEYVNQTTLSCTIDDNGVGRHAAGRTVRIAKRKSLGIPFTIQRLELMRKESGGGYGVEINDKKDDKGNSTGTRIIILMPILKNGPC